MILENGIELREIPNFPNYYAGSDGEIYSRNYKKNHIPKEFRKLTPGRQRLNYKIVCLKTDDGKRHMCRVHVLVCTAFHGERPEGLQCSHLDDDKENNTPQNLTWETDKQNKRRKFENGRGKEGFTHPYAKFKTLEECEKLVKMISSGMTKKQIASQLGCSPQVITDFRRNRTYKMIEGKIPYKRCLFDSQQIFEIREMISQGKRGVDIAKLYNCKPSVISDIKVGKRYRSVQ